MMKRVGVARIAAAPDDQPPLIITTSPQIQQQSVNAQGHPQQVQVGIHDNQTPHQTTIIVSTQQVLNYSKGSNAGVGGGGGNVGVQYCGTQFAATPAKPLAQPAAAINAINTINSNSNNMQTLHQNTHQRHKVGNQSPGGGNLVQLSMGPVGPGAGGASGGAFQRLKVEDALSYLDQVKYKFNNQPQVYNDFLDIMKEFKSQSIDTPGVIARVSNLFKGHPELIVGFNTFLPPGYKIEVQANDQGYAYQVSVSMPSPNSALQHQSHNNIAHAGQSVTGGGGGTSSLIVGPPQPIQQANTQHHLVQILPPSSSNSLVHNLSAAPTPSTTISTQGTPSLQISSPLSASLPLPLPISAAINSNSQQTNATVNTGMGMNMPTNTLHHISQAHHQLEQPAPPQNASQPVEFNHAIEYVNKIKNRFNRQPEKYKRFLEILHAYQRGQKELKEPQIKQQTEREVYSQVAKLFENQEDLLLEFGQFLPDASGGGGISGISGAAMKSATAAAALDAARPHHETLNSLSAANRPRPSQHLTTAVLQRGIVESALMETDSYHCPSNRAVSPVNSTGGVPSGSNLSYQTSAVTPAVTQPPSTQSASLPSAQRSSNMDAIPSQRHHPLANIAQHPASQVSTHHHQKHSGSSHHSGSNLSSSTHHLKRSPSFSSNNQLASSGGGPPAPKKLKLYSPRDVSYAEAAKRGTPSDFEFFEKVRKALRSQEAYDNFLRCLILFTDEIVSKTELLCVTTPFFQRNPELQRWLREFLGPPTSPPSPPHQLPAADQVSGHLQSHGTPSESNVSNQHHQPHHQLHSVSIGNGMHPYHPTPVHPYNSLSQGYGSNSGVYSSGGERYTGEMDTLGYPGATLRQDRPQGDAAMEVDLTTCKRLGTSYCALPRGSAESVSRRCSGRTALCRDVLNDSWVSFPTWAEDSTFVSCRKTQYEECIYRCEDERFELDVVIETNASTILALEGVYKKICRMTADEASRYRLDDCLGGSSPTIHQRALHRIYGEKAPDIIAGLKKNPLVAVPVVLRRLRAKEEEWRDAQKGFNKQWREQNEKFYLKSLDHQGVNFKQNDLKALRSKSLFNEIESIYDERRDQMASSGTSLSGCGGKNNSGPHLSAQCGPGGAALLGDAADLLIHHVRRQTAIQKQEKQRIKQLLRHFLPDLYCHPRMPLSDDERDDDEKESADATPDSPASAAEDQTKNSSANSGLADGSGVCDVDMTTERDSRLSSAGLPTTPVDKSSKTDIKQEKEASSDSDNPIPSQEVIRIARKIKYQENKENLRRVAVRNNSADSAEAKETTHSKIRRREGSTDSSGRIKCEPSTDANSNSDTFDKDKLPHNQQQQPVVFFGSDHWYVFLRLHTVLCQRLAGMKVLAQQLEKEEAGDARLRRPATAVALRLKPDNTLPVSQYYSSLLEMVRSVLDGNTDAVSYEDGLREMFGINAYIAFTLDKVVSNAVRQLQQCVQERVASRCVELHMQERAKGNAGLSAAHQRRAERLLREDHAFKICIYGGDECRVTFELLESLNSGAVNSSSGDGGGSGSGGGGGGGHGGGDGSGKFPSANSDAASHNTNQQTSNAASSASRPPPSRLADWSSYKEKYADPSHLTDSVYKGGKWCGRKAVFLLRNVRCYHRRAAVNGMMSPLTDREKDGDDEFLPPSSSLSPSSLLPRRSSLVRQHSSDEDAQPHHNKRKKQPLPLGAKKDDILHQNISSKLQTDVLNKDGCADGTAATAGGDQPLPPAIPGGPAFINDDRTECRFDINSYKMVFIVNKDQFLYKWGSLPKAKKSHKSVTLRLDGRWRSWLRAWCSRNVSSGASRATSEWFRHSARALPAGTPDRPPYANYTRYRLIVAAPVVLGNSTPTLAIHQNQNAPPAHSLQPLQKQPSSEVQSQMQR